MKAALLWCVFLLWLLFCGDEADNPVTNKHEMNLDDIR